MKQRKKKRMIRYPIPKVFIFFSIIIVILIGVSFSRFPKVLKCYKIYENALVQVENGERLDALDNLFTIIEQYPHSIPIATRMTDISMEGGHYEIAGSVISTYLADKEIDEEIVDRCNLYIDRINKFYVSLDALEGITSDLDAAMSQESARKENYEYIKGLLKDPKQDKALLYYYLALFTDDFDECKSFFENCIHEDSTFINAKAQLATMLLDLAYKAFEIAPENRYVWETYIIALNENGKNNEADTQIKKYIAKGNELEEATNNYLEGKLSLHDYYIDL